MGRIVGPQNTNGWTSGERADCHWGESPTEWASRPPNGRVAHRMGESPTEWAIAPCKRPLRPLAWAKLPFAWGYRPFGWATSP
uniref:Uncharacterized protein n=1 Tax=Caenorhabditis japonica TaxID=281687 RepID=A0A8R1ENZ0_CAEJA